MTDSSLPSDAENVPPETAGSRPGVAADSADRESPAPAGVAVDPAPTGESSAADAGAVRRLDEATVERIAAGEVVTRPAAVVRELVENALDAGASRIEVTVEGTGTDLLRVADDGRGMPAADAELAVERHTTSKVAPGDAVERSSTGSQTQSDDDAVEHAATLGFRGEALPSIAAVSRFRLVTNDGDGAGVEVRVDGEAPDADVAVSPAGRARGTTAEVRDLFYNRPARRKSLAAERTEFARVSAVVQRYALVRPDVAFTLVHDDRETLSTPGSGRFADAVLGVYDRTAASRSTAFEHETNLDLGGETVEMRIAGLLVYPSITRARRDHVHVAVNGRALTDERLRRAVVAGYGSLLPAGRAPVAVLTLSLPPGVVDANVHPAKTEVAFVDGPAVADAVETAVGDALSTADLRRSARVATDLEESLAPLDGDSVFADARVIGQYRETYLLAEADGDLLVVDQHAAHERVNYERLREAVGDPESVDLDPPETVSLSPAEAAVVDEAGDLLAAVGFDVGSFGGGTYRLRAVPAPLGRPADVDALRAAIDALTAGEAPEDARDDLLTDLACHPSLKAGDELSTDEAERLLARLGACDQPFACPHGRPTVLAVDEATFAEGFERHPRSG